MATCRVSVAVATSSEGLGEWRRPTETVELEVWRAPEHVPERLGASRILLHIIIILPLYNYPVRCTRSAVSLPYLLLSGYEATRALGGPHVRQIARARGTLHLFFALLPSSCRSRLIGIARRGFLSNLVAPRLSIHSA